MLNNNLGEARCHVRLCLASLDDASRELAGQPKEVVTAVHDQASPCGRLRVIPRRLRDAG